MGSKVFERLQHRRNLTGGPVGLHTIVLAMGSYLCEVNRYLERSLQPLSPEEKERLVPVLEEYRNFESAFTAFLKPPRGGRR